MNPLQEGELILLAEDIPHTKYAKLCDTLGFKFARSQSILATHHNDFIVAMQNILMEWKTKQTDATQLRSVLASKLHDSDLGGLGDKLSKGAYQPEPNLRDPRNQKTTPFECDSDIYNMKISDSLTVGQCRKKLEKRYLNSVCQVQMAPWDPNDFAELSDMHTVVTMMKKDSHGKDSREKQVLQGSVSEVFSTEVNGRQPLRILVSAPAGRGKTTAVAKMAYDWAKRVQGSSLENLPLLFAVKLRKAGKQTSIAEAIRSQLLSDVDDLTEDGLHSFIRRNQNICHIILDGLDEYAGIVRNQGQGSNIVDVMLWEEYPECRVLITTRPHLENFFNQGELPRVYTKMWIEGFSHGSSREYIDKFFSRISNPSHGHRLKVYLDSQPLINEIVVTPLFCLMVCHLWNEGSLKSDTTTQTELLDRVNQFLLHHANARSKAGERMTDEELGEIICKLGGVALAGLLDDTKKLVFTPHDFRKAPAILDKACQIGIVSKKTDSSAFLPRVQETTSTTIEFYHKLAQEHSAGKYLAAKTKKYMLRLKLSKLDSVLRKIRTDIGDYENLIRFAAGTDNSLCITVMEAILANRCLDESERYRILLDCSSETKGTEGNVSSLVQRCVNAERIVLKSPTVYTVVGMQNLPEQLKGQIREVKFEDSTPSMDAVSGLWSCMRTFSALRNLTISDCSLNFPPTSPELPSVMELKVERVTSQSYEGLLSSIPNVKEIDITVGNAENEDISQIQTSLGRHLTGQELTLIRLEEPYSLPSEETVTGMSRKTMGGLGLHISDESSYTYHGQQEATLLGVVCGLVEGTVIDLVQGSTRVMSSSLYSKQVSESLNSNRETINIDSLAIRDCKLTTTVTSSMWSCIRPFPSLSSLTISDSFLSFPPSPPELTSVIRLEVKRVKSQSCKGLLLSLPSLEEIDITMDDAERDIPQIMAGLRRIGGQQLARIALQAPTSLQPKKNPVSRETMRTLGTLIKDQTNNLQMLIVSGVNSGNEEDLVALIECCRHTKALDYLLLLCCGSKSGGRLESYAKDLLISKERPRVLISHEMSRFDIENYQLSTEMTIMLWSSLSSFTSMSTLTISDSSLSFPPSPPDLTSVTTLIAKRVTSQSYEGLLSSLSGLEVIDITIDDAERDISQITASLRRTGGQQLTDIRIEAPAPLPSEKKNVSRETMRGLDLLIRDQTKNLKSFSVSGVKCTEDDYVDLVKSSTILPNLHFGFLGWGSLDMKNTAKGPFMVSLRECQLPAEMTVRLWTCLRSFHSLSSLTISDSSLSFPPSSPELTSVTRLTADNVTSQSYDGLLSSLSGLKEIDITIDDVERDISLITAGLRRIGGQQLTYIGLWTHQSLPQEKKTISREAMRELGLLIREQTKNLQKLRLYWMHCTDEEDLVYLIECCRHVKTINLVELYLCGTQDGGRLVSHLKPLHSFIYPLKLEVTHDGRGTLIFNDYRIPHIQ